MNSEIKVDALKLSRGLRTTFEGIALIFDSIGADVELLTQVPAKKTSSSAPSAQTVKEPEPKPEPEQPQTEARARAAADRSRSIIPDTGRYYESHCRQG